MLNDLRLAFRSLLRTPGFTLVAILTLALGIGLNTAIFSLFNAALLRSLPVPNPQDLRVVNWIGDPTKMTQFGINGASVPAGEPEEKKWGSFTAAAYERFRNHAQGVSAVFAFAFQPSSATLVTRTGASTAYGLYVSGNFFAGYGAQPLLGRYLTAEDDRPGAAPAAVISYRLWQRQFALDPQVLGQTIRVNSIPFTIVGILPREYADPLAGNPSEFYMPLAFRAWMPNEAHLASPQIWALQVMARLAPGANDPQVQASMNALFKQVLLESEQKAAAGHFRIVLEDGSKGPLGTTEILKSIAKPIRVLMAAVAVLLLIACANLASLLLARTMGRTRELAVRAAIGASHWKLAQLQLTEGLLLAIGGGALGLVLAAWACSSVSQSFFVRWMGMLRGDAQLQASIDVRVLIFTLTVSLLTAVFFSVLPAWRAARADPLSGLKNVEPWGRSRLMLGGILVSVQVACSMVLLVGAGLLARTFFNLEQARPGFEADNLLLFDLIPGQSGYEGERKLRFYEAVRSSLASLPGVRGVTVSSQPLLGGRDNLLTIRVPGHPEPDARPGALDLQRSPMAGVIGIDESYFPTMGIPILLGGNMTAADIRAGSRVALVNQAFVRRYLKSKNPLGVEISPDGAAYRIVGVGGDARYGDLKRDIPPLVYLPLGRYMQNAETFAIRSYLPVQSLAPAIRKAVAAIDPKVPVTNMTTQRTLIDKSSSTERMLASFGGVVSVLAALLAGMGLFGLLAYTVSRRTSEIGIRMALGAQRSSVIRLILRQGAAMAAAGAVLGFLVAVWTMQLLRSFLWGVDATDPLTMIAAAGVLVLVAVAACLVPARRATRVDPVIALRAE